MKVALTEAEQQLLVEWNNTQADYPHVCVHELFEAQVERTPDAIAVVAGSTWLTYRALNQRANQLAHHLQSLGVKADSLVGICVERSPEMIVGMLGILKAGGAYVPLDSTYPKERLEFMLKDAEVEILLTSEGLLASLPQSEHLSHLVCLDSPLPTLGEGLGVRAKVQPNHLAYVIYTSGSTGKPKGGMMEHHSLVNLLWWHAQTRPASIGLKTLQFCAISFDFSFHEIFSTLCFGGPLVLVSEEVRRNPFAMAAFIHDNQIEKLFLPVTALQQLAEAVDSETMPSTLREVITTGEQLQITPAIANLFRQTGGMLHNHYGATEFQDATTFTLSGNPTDWPTLPPIGRPLSNVQIYILDELGQPVPIGSEACPEERGIGELYIGGAGVARGYLKRPELTKEKFIPNPFGTGRLYKTGDLARYRSDTQGAGSGMIENLGRADYQVKIRGVRIELGEIEAVLAKHPAVRENAVTACPLGMAHESGSTGQKRLVAYVVSREDSLSEQLLHSYLSERLPDYMLPEAFVVLDRMPLTPSGKVNRRKLPAPKTFRRTLASPVSMAQTETEQLLVEIWQEVLNIEAVGIHDNFFDIGATSLLLIQVHKKLLEHFASLPTVTLFQYPTIHALAEYLSQPKKEVKSNSKTGEKSLKIERKNGKADLAIIGMSGRFPGAADPSCLGTSIDTFWQNLRDGVESISFFSDSELSENDPTLLSDPNYVKAGAVLPNIESFDASFFGISPKEAAMMDPQQRLLLECAWEAFENAGYNPETYAGQVGVYAGSSLSTYLVNNVSPNLGYSATRPLIEADMVQLQVKLGNDRNYLPTRVSYKLNLKGPSVNVQTACSTALVAVHLARQSLLSGECDMALAGGISIIVPHKGGYLYEEGMIRSPDGHCRAFDAQAAGTLFGNGGGMVLLKRLDEAVADGDNIIAVIKGSAINNDGALKVGFTAPSYERQVDVIEAALAAADIDASTITYVEAHGTGTKLGDPIEIAALTQAFRQNSQQELARESCAVGSVKTNIGHLDEAAGIAGLIKTALALQHKEIPPSLHFQQPNPQIDFENSPFYVKTELSEWTANGHPRRAGVSSFGMGGTNSHLVLEEAPSQESLGAIRGDREHNLSRPLHLLTLSAKKEPALKELAERYVDYLASDAGREAGLANICFTANTGRKHFSHRAAFVVESNEQLREQLEQFLDSGAHGQESKAQTRRIAFLFTGQGSQYVDMGRQLYESQPVFRQTIDRCDEILRVGGYIPSLLSILYPLPGQASPINETEYTQPALFAVEYALYQVWKSWGIEPDVVMGHSVGEYVAACVAGVFTLEDGLKLIAERGRLMQALPRDGSMVSVRASEEVVTLLIHPYEPKVSIAAVNGPESVVISGHTQEIDALCAIFAVIGVKSKKLNVSHAFHSPLMEPMLADFERVAQQVTYSEPQIKLISNVTGQLVSHPQTPRGHSEVTKASYWVRHVRQPVRFAAGMASLEHLGANIFIEIGPNPVLLGMGRNCLPEHEGLWLPSLRPKQDDWERLLSSLRELYLAGVTIDWVGFDNSPTARGAYTRRRVPLPTYPWQRERHWIEPKEHIVTITQEQSNHPLIGQRLQLAGTQEIFNAQISPNRPSWLFDHRVFDTIVMPGTAYLEMALAAGAAVTKSDQILLTDVIIQQAMTFEDIKASHTIQVVLTPNQGELGISTLTGAKFEIFSLTAPSTGVSGKPVWTLHASGQLVEQEPIPEWVDLAALQAECDEPVSLEALSKRFKNQQIDYGPSFHVVKEVWLGDEGVVLGQIGLPAEGEYSLSANPYQLHPVLLDGVFQVLDAALLDNPDSYLPVGLERLHLMARPPANLPIWCHVQLRKTPKAGTASEGSTGSHDTHQQHLMADLRLISPNGDLIAMMEGARLKLASRQAMLRTQDSWQSWLYQVTWHPQVRFGFLSDYLPTAEKIRGSLETRLAELVIEADLATYGFAFSQLERLSLAYVVAAFRQMGWRFELGERFSTAQKASELGIVDQHRQLFTHLLDMLAEANILRSEKSMTKWEVISCPIRYRAEIIDPQEILRTAQNDNKKSEAKGAEAEMILVSRCGAKLADVLQGECDPIQLLFPAGDTTTLSKLYRDAPVLGVTNTLVQEAVLSALEQLPPGLGLRILEIGAGTGGTTAYLLPELPSDRTEYVFTDISAFFIAKAEERFKAYPFVRYQVLDIEQAPQTQGFEEHQYDLIVAADVLHATSDLRQTLTHVRQLLAPGGMLVLMEDCEPTRWADLTFGLTEGWWKFTDRDLRPNHPLLSPDKWQTLLKEMGFTQTTALWPEIDGSHKLPREAVIVARNDQEARMPRKWLILPASAQALADEEIGRHALVARRLAKQLRGIGEDCTLLLPAEEYAQIDSHTFTINPRSPLEWKRLLKQVPDVQEIVHCWTLRVLSTELGTASFLSCGSTLHLVQALASYPEPPRLSLVTQGAQAVNEHHAQNVAGSALWGMGKVIALEHPELSCLRVDLDPLATTEAQVEALMGELLAIEEPAPAILRQAQDTASMPREEEIAFREQTRYVARLSRKSHAADNQEPLPLRRDGSYLIAGGLGGLGLLVARFLATHGAKHLVLVGRRGARKEHQPQLSELEELGAQVTVVQADIADAEQLAEALSAAISPPLRGVIHAAGTLNDGILQQQSWQAFEEVMAPKVAGAWNLHTQTFDQPLDFFILFSSATSLLGNAGQANHAAANAFLDALASYRRHLGLPSLSINWGTWSEVGIAARLGLDKLSKKQGEETIAPKQGLQILEQLLKDQAHQVGVIPIDWPQLLSRQLVPQPFFSDVMTDSLVAHSTLEKRNSRTKGHHIREQLENASPKQALILLQTHVHSQVAQVLGVDVKVLLAEQEVNFFTLGMDSLSSIELRNRLQTSLNCSLPTTLLFDYPTQTALLAYLAQELLKIPEIKMGSIHGQQKFPTVVSLQTQGSNPPLFFVPGVLGMTFELQQLASVLGPEQPFYGLRSLGLEKEEEVLTSLADMAAYHIQALQSIQPKGPYLIGGYSFGGEVAFEMAQQLRQQGNDISMLYILDIPVSSYYGHKGKQNIASWDDTKLLASFAEVHGYPIQQDLEISLQTLYSLLPDKRLAYVVEQLNTGHVSWNIDEWQRMFNVFKANMRSSSNHTPQINRDIPITLLRASEVGILDFLPGESETEADPSWGWYDLAGDSLEMKLVPGNHFTMLTHPHVKRVSNIINNSLNGLDSQKSEYFNHKNIIATIGVMP